MTFVIPRFATIFKDLNQAIPLPTQILLAISGTLQQYWWVGMILVLAASSPGGCGRPHPRAGCRGTAPS